MAFSIRSNVATVKAAWDADTTPQNNDFCLELNDDITRPWDLQVSIPDPDNSLSGLFSTPQRDVRLPCGSLASPVCHQVSCGFLKIELGGGSDSRVLYCDLADGRYALGAQRWIRVTAWGWSGTSLRTKDLQVYTSLVAGDGTGDYLEVTYPIVLVPPDAASGALWAPPGARFVDAGASAALIGNAGQPLIRTTFGHPMVRDYSTPLFVPGLASPTPVNAAEPRISFLDHGGTGFSATHPGWVKWWCA